MSAELHNVAAGFLAVARQQPALPALLEAHKTVTYAELAQRAARLAAQLAAHGVTPGDRVVIDLPNSVAFVVAYFAVQWLGAVTVAVNPALQTDEKQHVVDDSGARMLIVEQGRREQPVVVAGRIAVSLSDAGSGEVMSLDAIPSPGIRASSDPAAILYTSGTTGRPKGAVLSQANICFNSSAKRACCGFAPGERALLFVPMFHCFGQNAVMNSALHAGATLVLQNGFQIDSTVANVARHAVTMLFGVPTVFAALHERVAPRQLAGVRYFFSGAALLPRALADAWAQRFGRPVYQGYGMTESSPFAAYVDERAPAEAGIIGRPVPGVEMAVLDTVSHQPLPAGSNGQLAIRGPNVMIGYWNKPRETAQVMHDGWLLTGDAGRVDAHGNFYLIDRIKDMINVSGLKVYPAEVEHVLSAQGCVAEAAVYAVPDALLGEVVGATVVLRGPLPDADPGRHLMRACRSRLAAYKVPVRIEFAESLPKGGSGKVLRRVAQANAQQARAAAQAPTFSGIQHA
jgi:long-chain acyl-CoA synthetase